jgi:hypothetical protein
MASARQTEANQQNALASTGPKTAAGKGRSSRNALKHGAYSALPVLPGLERAEDWEAHRSGILQSLAPAGNLEEALAERVALALWRLKRTAAYETATTAVGLEAVEDVLAPRVPPPNPVPPGLEGLEALEQANLPLPEALGKALHDLQAKQRKLEERAQVLGFLEQVSGLPESSLVSGDDAWAALREFHEAAPEDGDYPDRDDARFLARLGVPKDELHEPFDWPGWTAGMVRAGLAAFAKAAGWSPEKLLARSVEGKRAELERGRAKVK